MNAERPTHLVALVRLEHVQRALDGQHVHDTHRGGKDEGARIIDEKVADRRAGEEDR